MSKIERNAEACYGCRTCELACSFHHQRVFSPEHASIKVSLNNRTDEIYWDLDSTCDSCKDEPSPLCVRYCVYGALRESK
jgi:carbon-monoxide dehydrogenase iron sulfur subunit